MGYLAANTEHRASEAAWSLGHDWLGPEHLMLSLAASRSSAGDALRASGVQYERLIEDIDGLSGEYHGARRAGSDSGGWPLRVSASAQRVIARAEGIAAGQGSVEISGAYLVLALLWERQTCVPISLLKRRGITRERVLDELGRRGVRLPDAPLPQLPDWGPLTAVADDDWLPLLGNLRRAGHVYCTAFKDGQHYVSIARAPTHTEHRS